MSRDYWHDPDPDLGESAAFDALRDTRARYRAEQAAKDAAAAAPRNFTQRDIDAYERAAELQDLRQAARDIHMQEVRMRKVEKLMQRDISAYYDSPWHDWYSKITGSAADAKERTR
jgi:hypothetical protein